MTELTQVDALIAKRLQSIIVRMADEGTPLRAIARATQWESTAVRAVLNEALNNGTIVEMPRDDWPPGSIRNERLPGIPVSANDEKFQVDLVHHFKITKLHAKVFGALLRHQEVTKKTLHRIIDDGIEPDEEGATQEKIVDVVICHLRKRLRPTGVAIRTIWGCGYFMEPEHKKLALDLLEKRRSPSAGERAAVTAAVN